jgi:hypothetical protein
LIAVFTDTQKKKHREIVTTPNSKPKRILAIASGGGHWVQLLRLRPAFEGCDVTYASVRPAYADDVPGQRFVTIPDATRWDRWRLLMMMIRVAWLVGRLRPDVILSTGAAPGYVAIRLGKILGSKTVWLDSIANVEVVSMSGQKIGAHADLWLTQWEHLAADDGPKWKGAVL